MTAFGWTIMELRGCHILYQFLSPGGKLFSSWNMEEYRLKVKNVPCPTTHRRGSLSNSVNSHFQVPYDTVPIIHQLYEAELSSHLLSEEN